MTNDDPLLFRGRLLELSQDAMLDAWQQSLIDAEPSTAYPDH